MMAVKTKTSVLLRLAYGVAFGALAATSPALAADVAMPAYKAAAAPAAYDWSGFYLGVTAGGGMASLPVTSMDFFVGIGAMKSAGAVGGVHAGYNWQFTPSFLVGLEGDFNWASFKESDTTCFGSCALNLIGDRSVASSRLDQFSTLRARFGLTSDRTLVYVTAGPAWGHIDASLAELGCPNCDAGAPRAIASDSSFHIGIALGAGVEYALTQNWILRGEYMHLDVSTTDTVFKHASTGIPFDGVRARSTATADLARLGISYKLW